MFFITNQAQAQKDYSQADLIRATALASAVRTARRVMRPFRTHDWAVHYSKLRTADRIDDQRIQEVHEFYIKHVGEPFIPQAYSAKGFREKFPAIESAMLRHRERNPEPLSLTDDGKKVVKSLQHLHWPKGSADKLPQAVEQSLLNYQAVLAKYSAFIKANREPKGVVAKGAVILIKSLPLLHPADFTTDWFQRVFKKVHGWEGWGGGFKGFVFSGDHKDFEAMIRGKARSEGAQEESITIVLGALR